MKTLHAKATKSLLRTPALFLTAAATAAAFWFCTTSVGFAVAATCTVCHKKSVNMTFLCSDSEYQRHLGHGDTMGACAASRSEKDRERAKE
jgi:hypothetical protein